MTVLWSGAVAARIQTSGGYRLAKPFTVDGLPAVLHQVLPDADPTSAAPGPGR